MLPKPIDSVQIVYGQWRQPDAQQYARFARKSAVNTLRPLAGSA